MLSSGARQLFEEERIALGLRHDELREGAGELFGAKDDLHDCETVLGR